jgi:hypothetical protein
MHLNVRLIRTGWNFSQTCLLGRKQSVTRDSGLFWDLIFETRQTSSGKPPKRGEMGTNQEQNKDAGYQKGNDHQKRCGIDMGMRWWGFNMEMQ